MGCIQKRNAISIKHKNKYHFTILKYKNISNNIKEKFSTNYNSEVLNCFDKDKTDILNYSELKETGKVNKMFNKNVKQKELLIKFFKKRESFIINDFEDENLINTLMSFSMLQKKNISSDDDLSFNEE